MEKQTFRLEKGGIQKTVVQYQLNWPDFGVIDPQTLAELVIEIDRVRAENPSSPILAHCSAGLGRTGTFFAVLEGYDRLKMGTAAPGLVFEIVSQLRAERPNTKEQYRLIYDTLEILSQRIATTD